MRPFNNEESPARNRLKKSRESKLFSLYKSLRHEKKDAVTENCIDGELPDNDRVGADISFIIGQNQEMQRRCAKSEKKNKDIEPENGIKSPMEPPANRIADIKTHESSVKPHSSSNSGSISTEGNAMISTSCLEENMNHIGTKISRKQDAYNLESGSGKDDEGRKSPNLSLKLIENNRPFKTPLNTHTYSVRKGGHVHDKREQLHKSCKKDNHHPAGPKNFMDNKGPSPFLYGRLRGDTIRIDSSNAKIIKNTSKYPSPLESNADSPELSPDTPCHNTPVIKGNIIERGTNFDSRDTTLLNLFLTPNATAAALTTSELISTAPVKEDNGNKVATPTDIDSHKQSLQPIVAKNQIPNIKTQNKCEHNDSPQEIPNESSYNCKMKVHPTPGSRQELNSSAPSSQLSSNLNKVQFAQTGSFLSSIKNPSLKKSLKKVKSEDKGAATRFPFKQSTAQSKDESGRLETYMKLLDLMNLKYSGSDNLTVKMEDYARDVRGYLYTIVKSKWAKVYHVIGKSGYIPEKPIELWRNGDLINRISIESVTPKKLSSIVSKLPTVAQLNLLGKDKYATDTNVIKTYLYEFDEKTGQHLIHDLVLATHNPPLKPSIIPSMEPPEISLNDPKRCIIIDKWKQDVAEYQISDFYQFNRLCEKITQLSHSILTTYRSLKEATSSVEEAFVTISKSFSHLSLDQLKEIVDCIIPLKLRTLTDKIRRETGIVIEGNARLAENFFDNILSSDSGMGSSISTVEESECKYDNKTSKGKNCKDSSRVATSGNIPRKEGNLMLENNTPSVLPSRRHSIL